MGRGIRLGGGATIILVLAALFLGADPGQLIGMLEAPQNSVPPSARQGNDEAADFVSAVLGDTEDTWGQLFASRGSQYRAPRLVMYDGMVQSACGTGSAAAGPFYCPGDHKVYLDLGFLRELQRLGAPGDFAFAYVIAHEIGHHVQNLAGTADRVRSLQVRSSRRDANALSVMMELQADCYAGIWAHHAHQQRNLLEDGDVEEGLAAAAAVGDDRLQRMSGRGVHPESFTHGSSDQRVHWFRAGLRSGRLEDCDTFVQAHR